MGILGTRWARGPLECPECGGNILWDGKQHVCISCPWQEFVARPPSERKIAAPQKRAEKNE